MRSDECMGNRPGMMREGNVKQSVVEAISREGPFPRGAVSFSGRFGLQTGVAVGLCYLA